MGAVLDERVGAAPVVAEPGEAANEEADPDQHRQPGSKAPPRDEPPAEIARGHPLGIERLGGRAAAHGVLGSILDLLSAAASDPARRRYVASR